MKSDQKIDVKDIKYETKRGTGPGGQHRNKTESCVIATHKPTGISVKIDARNQHKNKVLATRLLSERVEEQKRAKESNARDKKRSNQVGSGMRADKRRTYRQKDDAVVDHITGKNFSLKAWMKGNW